MQQIAEGAGRLWNGVDFYREIGKQDKDCDWKVPAVILGRNPELAVRSMGILLLLASLQDI